MSRLSLWHSVFMWVGANPRTTLWDGIFCFAKGHEDATTTKFVPGNVNILRYLGIDREAIFWLGPGSIKWPGSPLDSYFFASQYETHLESNLFSMAEGTDLCLLATLPWPCILGEPTTSTVHVALLTLNTRIYSCWPHPKINVWFIECLLVPRRYRATSCYWWTLF